MRSGFWKTAPRPIFGLAPMANVTDAAFRHIVAKYGKPDVLWTEFVACDGLQSPGREALLIDFMYSEIERPIVAQIFGAKPENFYTTALLIQELGFDGIDINLGCPDKNVLKQQAGGALIKTPLLAKKIIEATKRGAGNLPVSLKTRAGFNKPILNEWLPHLLETEPAAITIHARTCKELSLVPARWEHIAEAVQIRDHYFGTSERPFATTADRTLILGNGDVKDIAEAKQKIAETGCDGVMIGRGIFGNPWLFKNIDNERTSPAPPSRGKFFDPPSKGVGGMLASNVSPISIQEKLRVLVEHTYLYEKLLSEHKSFAIMKKHYKAYVNGFPGAKELRFTLMEAPNAEAVAAYVQDFIKTIPSA